MNSDALQKENIELILKLMPTTEEISMITDQQQQRPGAPLASAEQFLVTLNSIAELQARLKIWAFKLDFTEKEREMANQLSDLRVAIQQIRDSKTLTKVLACLLAIGNHLNDRHVKAFGIEYLQKAPEVKDTTGKKQSLVYHVVTFLGGEQVDANVADLYDELGAVTRCTRVDWDQVKYQVDDLEQKCRTSWEQLRSLNQQDDFR